jgi:putative endonuclease
MPQDKPLPLHPGWFLYLIECQDGSIYTGITTDVVRRYAEHVSGKGARYTRAHPPKQLLAVFPYADRAAVSRAEYITKQLSAQAKWQLVHHKENCFLPSVLY